MIKEDRIAAILLEAPTLDEAVDRLVAEANEAGGRDNITVVAFRLEEAEVAAERPEDLTLVGPAAEEAGLTAAGVEAEAERQRAATRERARVRPGAPARRWPRRTVTALVTLVVTVGLAVLAVWGVRQIYFLGTDSGGRLALYRGLPYDLPLGIHLYSEVYAAPVQVRSVPANRRDSATNHTLRFHDDAVSLLDDLQAAADRRIAARQRASQPSANTGTQGGGGKTGGSSQGGSGSGGAGGGGGGTGGSGGGGSGAKNGGAG
jgi:protein phosphatase